MDALPPKPTVSFARARAAIAAEFSLLGAGAGIWAVHIPIVQARLSIDPATIGLALLVFSIGSVATMPLTGALAARHGSRPVTAALGITFPFLPAFTILAPSLPLLCIGAFFFGAAMGGLDVAMNAQAAEYEVARGRPVMSSFHAFFSIGALCGSAAGGALIGAGYANGSAAVILSVVLLVTGIAAAPNLWPAPVSHRTGLRLALPHGRLLVLGTIAFLAFSAEGAVADWSALYLAKVKGADLAAAAYGYVAFSIVMVICRLSGDWAVVRLGPVATLAGGGLIIAAGILIAILSPVAIGTSLGFAIVGLGAANAAPVAFSAAARVPGVTTSVGAATVTTMGYAGALVFPALLGFIGNTFGLSAALLIVVAMGLVVSAMSGVVRG